MAQHSLAGRLMLLGGGLTNNEVDQLCCRLFGRDVLPADDHGQVSSELPPWVRDQPSWIARAAVRSRITSHKLAVLSEVEHRTCVL